MKKTIFLIGLIICLLINFGCAKSQEQNQKEYSNIEFSTSITDTPQSIVKIAGKKIGEKLSTTLLEKQKELEEKNAQVELIENENLEESFYNDYNYNDTYGSDYVNYEWNSTSSNSGLTQQSGVNYYDGRTETYYSSNALYHYRTNEWTVDDEGFYRTDDGYYVVAASDIPQGATFEGSKGICIVLDSGCSEGITDYYVAW